MSIFFLKRLKKRNNNDNFTTPIVTWFPDSYYNRRFYAADSPFKLDLRS